MTPTSVIISVNYTPVVMVAHDSEAVPEPFALNQQVDEFIRTWTSTTGLDLPTVIDEFEREWLTFEAESRQQFAGLVVRQRSIVTYTPMGEAAVIVSAEKYATRSSSENGTLSRAFTRDPSGRAAFRVSLVDFHSKTRKVSLADWLRNGAKDIEWAAANTYFFGATQLVR